MIPILLLRILTGIIAGAATVGTGIVIYEFVSKSNIGKIIKDFIAKLRALIAEKNTEKCNIFNEDLFAARVKKAQEDSVKVDVFFGKSGSTMIEDLPIPAKKVDDDISTGEWIDLTVDS